MNRCPGCASRGAITAHYDSCPDRREWPHSDEEWCAYFRKLDRQFKTHPHSPLHHDNRCPLHQSAR